MSLSNKCYQRRGLQDPNDPTKCLDPERVPTSVTHTDAFGNQWYDFNVDYDKKGLQISDTECEDRPTDDYERRDIECVLITTSPPINPENRVEGLRYVFVPDAGDWTRANVDNETTHTSNDVYVRDYIRRDTDNNPYDMEVCPREIIIQNPFIPDQVSISDYEFTTENNLLISSEEEPSYFFEPEVNTFGDDLQFTP
jgi:hypothetical protein